MSRRASAQRDFFAQVAPPAAFTGVHERSEPFSTVPGCTNHLVKRVSLTTGSIPHLNAWEFGWIS